MQDFATRSTQAEWMDGSDISFEEFHACLKELEVINHWTFAYRPTLHWLKNIQAQSVLDIGSGGGDMLRQICKHSKNVQLTGIDINPWAAQSAKLQTPSEMQITYETNDIFAIKPQADVIISSLFTHHLDDETLVRFLRWMQQHAVKGWLINDLHRHPVPFYFIKYAVRLFSRNRLIRHDAPVSVARAFTRKDWQELLTGAGIPLEHTHIEWFFPFRYIVSCRKT